MKLIPAAEHRSEISVSNSRFVTSIAPAFSVEEARAFITRIRQEYKDASHNVPAFIIGHGKSVVDHCHDDGEPSGTAGRPALAVLRGSGIGDIAAVVSRYFGGTKLGKGGLVRAYGDAVKEALSSLTLAQKTATHTVQFSMPYSFFERARLLVESFGGVILDETFATDVTITARLSQKKAPAFREDLRELSHGELQAEIVASDEATILPYT
jgi:uncharacterized YigZ family protein